MRIYEDLRLVHARLSVGQHAVVVVLGLLLAFFWNLQVMRGRHFRDLAEQNRMRTVRLAAPRGLVVDRAGRLLVENRPSFNILLTPEHSDDLDRAVARLGSLLGIGEAQIRERLARRAGPFRPVVVESDASLAHVAAVEARRTELPEVAVEVVPLRAYPLHAEAAHALGRVGEVTETQLASPAFEEASSGDLVGQAGIEYGYNRALLGQDGYRRVIVNSRGAEVDEAERQSPVEGPTLTLALDARLQEAMEAALAGLQGSAVALDPRTGEVLGMTSVPAYDPNVFSRGIEQRAWRTLVENPATPLMNRVIQGQYAPGSVFKIVMAIAGLEEGLVTPQTQVYCPGYLSIYGTVFRCNRPGGHGRVRLREALGQSCNVYFYQLGVRLEIERIAHWARVLGLGSRTGIDLPHEASGLIPSPEWKRRTRGAPWYAGETVSVAIGQGQTTTTPLQLARVAAVVASGGALPTPHVVRAVGGDPLTRPAPRPLGLHPETLDAVREGLCAAVEAGGTAWRARIPGVRVCGKTGSAQVVTRDRLAAEGADAPREMLPHAWFVCFAPREAPRIALAVLVEHGGSGGVSAAPVAHDILARYFHGPDRDAVPGVAEAD